MRWVRETLEASRRRSYITLLEILIGAASRSHLEDVRRSGVATIASKKIFGHADLTCDFEEQEYEVSCACVFESDIIPKHMVVAGRIVHLVASSTKSERIRQPTRRAGHARVGAVIETSEAMMMLKP